MADLTFKQAQTQNELVTGTPGANQQQITGTEVLGATSSTDVNSGVSLQTIQSYADTGFLKGPANAVDSNLVAFDGTTGKSAKDAGYAMPTGGTAGQALVKIDATNYNWSWQNVGDVFGPATSVDENIVVFNGATGKTIADGGIKSSQIVALSVSSQYGGVPNKASPVSGDLLLIEDSAATGAKKNISIGSLPDKVVPDGGTEGQIIAKQSATEQDAIWIDVPIAFSTNWKFDSSTAASDPGNGFFRLNAATQAATTQIYVSQESANSIDLGSLLGTLNTGEQFIAYEQQDNDRAALYEISATPTDNGTWWTIPVTFLDQGVGEYRSGRNVNFQFFGISAGGIGEAPNDSNRTYFRDGTGETWTKSLKGYGELSQATAASGSETIAVDDGNTITSNLTGAYTLTALTASLSSMSATWLLQHNSNTVTFPASFKFPGGNPPSGASGNAWLLAMFTVDSGTTWIVSFVDNYTV